MLRQYSFVFNKNRLFLPFLAFCSILYFSTVNFYLHASELAQAGIFIVVLIWLSIRGATYTQYSVLVALTLFFLANGLYVINLLAIYLAYILSFRVDIRHISKIVIIFSAIVAVLSILHFYFEVSIMYHPIYYQHYLYPDLYRLIGLDASPTMVAFSAGISLILLMFFNENRTTGKSLLALMFLIVVFLTASRVALLGVLLAYAGAILKRTSFSLLIMTLCLFPIIITILYLSIDSYEVKVFIESITSNRIVNWANLLDYFSGLSFIDHFFGIGKPPIIFTPLILEGYSGEYQYQFVRYAESSWLKIFVYHGFAAYLVVLIVLFILSRKLSGYKYRAVVLYFVFSAIFYDSILSLQYLLFMILFFAFLTKKKCPNLVCNTQNKGEVQK